MHDDEPAGRVPVYYGEDYAIAQEEFDTTRKARWVREALDRDPLPAVAWRVPRPADAAMLSRVHASAWIEAVRTGAPRELAQAQGFTWDPGLWTAACASTGGMVAALEAALAGGVAGSLSTGQHHASRERGGGFCTFNGIALAALRALDLGAHRVLIVDLDAHCAGGTHGIVAGHGGIRQLDIAVSAFDRYAPAANATLDLVDRAQDYLPTLAARLAALDAEGERFDACLYYAGMDPHERCAIGGLSGIDRALLARREAAVFEWCAERGVPVAFGIGGGYTGPRLARDALVGLHRLTLAAACAVAPRYSAARGGQAHDVSLPHGMMMTTTNHEENGHVT